MSLCVENVSTCAADSCAVAARWLPFYQACKVWRATSSQRPSRISFVSLPRLSHLSGRPNWGAFYSDWNLWRRYGAIPETFHCVKREAENLDYPFRPEFVESTYFLYLVRLIMS